jgi:hypothetical protein
VQQHDHRTVIRSPVEQWEDEASVAEIADDGEIVQISIAWTARRLCVTEVCQGDRWVFSPDAPL